MNPSPVKESLPESKGIQMNTTPGAPTDAQIDEMRNIRSHPSTIAWGAEVRRILSLHPAPSAAEPGAQEPDHSQTPADFATWLLGMYRGMVIDQHTMARAIAEYNDDCEADASDAEILWPDATPSTAQGLSDAEIHQIALSIWKDPNEFERAQDLKFARAILASNKGETK